MSTAEALQTAVRLGDGAHVVFLFFVYGILGWMVEVAYAGVTERKLINRGFLCGPICPIYGFGMLALVTVIKTVPAPSGEATGPLSWVRTFLVGMLVTTLIELVGGWALFKIYHTRWWDYSNFKFNFHGYICPQFSVLWGLGSLVMVKVVHPMMRHVDLGIPLFPLLIIDGVLLLGFGVDLGVSTAAAVGLDKKLHEIDELRAKLSVTSNKLTSIIGGNAITADTLLEEPKLQLTLAAMEGRSNAADAKAELMRGVTALRAKLDDLSADSLGANRLIRAFPAMRSDTHGESISTVHHYANRLRAGAASAKAAATSAASSAKAAATSAASSAKTVATNAAASAKEKMQSKK